jgi:hypothetical protein
MNLEWFRKNLSFLAVSGVSLIIVGALFSPFIKYPPGKDSNGYYLINQRTKERSYSDEAKETYIRYWVCNFGITVGVGMIVFIPIIIVFDRNRKRSSITQQANHDQHPNEA